ncbi:hypothetical protein [Flavobacterium cellulosilyticum]|uniref:Uncharacterized protein n=1 Tax=Flavobacterium cellulosilyticum TaxID=2541731 RepID=A0A4R5CAK3_9FLAO|nr:hypothetical protein [Flavobacterium cellulosilyticum]TDD96948.1 hypothetical protein E0F76_09900 [Flavobacterium cellulosilyticum]
MKVNHCNGQCFLSIQLKKAAEKEKKEAANLREKQELVYIYSVSKNHFTPQFSSEKSKVLITLHCEKPTSIQLGIFRPPLV